MKFRFAWRRMRCSRGAGGHPACACMRRARGQAGARGAQPREHTDHGDAAWWAHSRACPTVTPTSRATGCRTAQGRASAAATASIRRAAASSIRRRLRKRSRHSSPGRKRKSSSMTPVEKELAKSSVNCMPRGLPAIWLQNPYSTVIVHTPTMMAQLYEVLNNWRLVYTRDGRPLPKDPEPWFHGTSTTHWDGDTLVVNSFGFDERTFVMPTGWFHSDAMKVTERYTRPSKNYLHRRDYR